MTLSAPPCEIKKFIPFRPAELKVFRRKKRLPGPQWMERNVHVPIGSRQGLYRNQNNPAMYGVLDWATRSHVRVVVMAKGIQIGGTLGFYGLLLREGEYSADKALVVMADERTVKKLSKGRLRVMIDKSPALAALKSSNPDDTAIYSIELANGFTIDIGWASSEVTVSSESYRVVILDEISKYKARGNIQDAKARTTVFPDTCKIWMFSSPGVDTDDPETRDPLMVEAENCDVMLDYHVICPDCGQEQVMLFAQFKWPGQTTLEGNIEADPRAIRRNRSAWYECIHCKSRWNDYKRDKAILAAMKDGWKPTDPEAPEFPQSVYFHLPSWLSPFVSLSDVAADWLEAQGDDEKLRKWHNRHAAVSYRYGTKERQEAAILRLRDEHLPRGVVPEDSSCVLLSVDTQRVGFHYQFVAFGWGMPLQPTLIDHGFVEDFESLKLIAIREFTETGSGRIVRALAGFIDSGGGTNPDRPKHSRTREVYDFCILNPFFRPLKGARTMQSPWDVRKIEYYPSQDGKKIPIPGMLNLYRINTTIYKDELAGKIGINPGDPGGLRLHAGTNEEYKGYAAQMCAEFRNDRGYWECPRNKDNHHWDVSVYALAGADILQVKLWPRPEDQPAAPQGRRIRNSGIQR